MLCLLSLFRKCACGLYLRLLFQFCFSSGFFAANVRFLIASCGSRLRRCLKPQSRCCPQKIALIDYENTRGQAQTPAACVSVHSSTTDTMYRFSTGFHPTAFLYSILAGTRANLLLHCLFAGTSLLLFNYFRHLDSKPVANSIRDQRKAGCGQSASIPT